MPRASDEELEAGEFDWQGWRGFEREWGWTPIPDKVFDLLLNRITPAEFKVLMYIARHTWGWKKDSDRMSQAQMVKGIQRKDGTWQDYGTGLSRAGVRKAVQGLEEKRLIIVTREFAANGNRAVNVYRIRMADDD